MQLTSGLLNLEKVIVQGRIRVWMIQEVWSVCSKKAKVSELKSGEDDDDEGSPFKVLYHDIGNEFGLWQERLLDRE